MASTSPSASGDDPGDFRQSEVLDEGTRLTRTLPTTKTTGAINGTGTSGDSAAAPAQQSNIAQSTLPAAPTGRSTPAAKPQIKWTRDMRLTVHLLWSVYNKTFKFLDKRTEVFLAIFKDELERKDSPIPTSNALNASYCHAKKRFRDNTVKNDWADILHGQIDDEELVRCRSGIQPYLTGQGQTASFQSRGQQQGQQQIQQQGQQQQGQQAGGKVSEMKKKRTSGGESEEAAGGRKKQKEKEKGVTDGLQKGNVLHQLPSGLSAVGLQGLRRTETSGGDGLRSTSRRLPGRQQTTARPPVFPVSPYLTWEEQISAHVEAARVAGKLGPPETRSPEEVEASMRAAAENELDALYVRQADAAEEEARRKGTAFTRPHMDHGMHPIERYFRLPTLHFKIEQERRR